MKKTAVRSREGLNGGSGRNSVLSGSQSSCWLRPPHVYVTEEAGERDNRRDTTDQKLIGVTFEDYSNPPSGEENRKEGDQKFCLRQVDRAVW